jgi:NADP-dependent 3-hydroxy acid dehydrogenase YdfG
MNEPSFSNCELYVFLAAVNDIFDRSSAGEPDMKQKLAEKVVFITGASSGIGEGLAREAAAQGAAVALVARRQQAITRVAAEIEAEGGRALAVAGDVTRDGDMEAAVAQTLDRFGRIDIAIANAGLSVNGPVAHLGIDDFQRQFDTNVLGVIRTVKAVLPAVTEVRGSIALTGSTNGYLSLPGYSAYCASKHAVRSLADCLRHELAAQQVSVTHLAPGFVQSDIRLRDRRGQLRADAVDPIPRWLQLPARRAARQMLRAIIARRAQAIITMHSRLGILAARHMPWLVSAILRVARRPLIAASLQS